MPAVLIIFGILLCIYLLLLLPIVVTADLGSEPAVFLKYLCFKFRLYPKPQKQKKEKPEKKGQQKQQQKSHRKKKTERKSISHYVDKYGDLVKSALKLLGKLTKHLTVNRLEVSVTVGDEDAAKVAVEYGAVCAALYPTLGLLDSVLEIKQSEINITPDYDSKTSKGTFYADVRIRAFHVVAALFGLASSLIKYLNK